MLSQHSAFDNDPSLKEMIQSWQSGDKIRRPPNAFMLFAKDHRKRLAEENPHLSNKVISEMLGKDWKKAPDEIKQHYYKKSNVVRSLHSKQFPGYHYSPIEARKRKSEKLKRSNEALQMVRDENPETKKEASYYLRSKIPYCEVTGMISQEGERSGLNDEASTSAGYVPNNPEYFTQQFNQPAGLNTIFRDHENNPSKSEQNQCRVPSYTMGESSSRNAWEQPSTYSSRTEHYPGTTSSVFYGNAASPYYQYWNSGLVRPPFYCQREDDRHEGLYPGPDYTSAQYRPPLEHHLFDRSAMPYYRNSGFGFYRQFNTSSQASGNEFPVQNLETGEFFREKQFSTPCKSAEAESFLESSYLTTACTPDNIQLASKKVMPNSFSQFPNILKRIPCGYENSLIKRDYDDPNPTEIVMNISLKNESVDSSPEVGLQIDTCSSDSEPDYESAIPQAAIFSIKNEFTQPAQEPLVGFGGLISSTMHNLGMEMDPMTSSLSNSTLNNKITTLDSKLDNEAETTCVVIKQELPHILDTNMLSNNSLNNKSIASKLFNDQTNNMDNSDAASNK